MTSQHRAVVVMLLLSLFSARAPGFSLSKRAVGRNQNNHFADALKVIQREKRRVLFDERGQDWPDSDEEDYFDGWDDSYPRLPPGYDQYGYGPLGLESSDRYGDDDIVQSQGTDWNSLFDESEDQPDVETDEDGGGEGPSVSKDELEDIFADISDNKAQKRNNAEDTLLADSLLGPAGKRRAAAEKREDYRRDESFKKNALSPEELDKLLKSVDDDEVEELGDEDSASEEDEEEDKATTPVSEEEIKELFSDLSDEGNEDVSDNGGQDITEIDTSQQGIEEEPDVGGFEDTDASWPLSSEEEDPNKEWLISHYLKGADAGDPKVSTKRKRSDHSPLLDTLQQPDSGYGFSAQATGDGDTAEELANELAMARADIKLLRNFLRLEDDENANLAKALNYATKSQTERSDKYVEEEIELIKNAIQDEMNIQEVKDVVQIAASLKGAALLDMEPEVLEEEEDEEEEEPSPIGFGDIPQETYEDKRGHTQFEEPEGDFQMEIPEEDILEDDVIETDPDEISDEDLIRVLLESKLRHILGREPEPQENDLYDKSKGLNAWYDRPVPTEDNTPEDWYLHPMTRQLWEQLQAKVDKRGYDIPSDEQDVYEEDNGIDLDQVDDSVLEELADAAMCPAVDDFTDDCAFVNGLGLGLDEEATDLCNRHQLCYACGAALDLSPEDCDRGYLGEAAKLCEHEDECDDEAASLFLLMLEHHNYLPLSRTSEECPTKCTQEYIAGTPFLSANNYLE